MLRFDARSCGFGFNDSEPDARSHCTGASWMAAPDAAIRMRRSAEIRGEAPDRGDRAPLPAVRLREWTSGPYCVQSRVFRARLRSGGAKMHSGCIPASSSCRRSFAAGSRAPANHAGNRGAVASALAARDAAAHPIRIVRTFRKIVDQHSHGDNMLKMNRLANLAAALALALPLAVSPIAAFAQAQPATPAPAAAPADTTAAPPAAPAPAPAANNATASKAAPSTEVIENPYGLQALWKGGDLVARITLGILVVMSAGSWYIIVTKVYEQSRMNLQARAADRTFWKAASVQKGTAELRQGSPYRFIAESGLEATTKHEGLLGNVDINTWVSMSIQRAIDNIQSRTQDGLAFLATVGSTAPFVGLFGTVWGIYHALTAIGIAGQASIDKVAGPVGEALIMTAIGLAVAVPAVLGYNWLVRRNKSALEQVRGFGAELHQVLLGAEAKKNSENPPRVVHAIRAISI